MSRKDACALTGERTEIPPRQQRTVSSSNKLLKSQTLLLGVAKPKVTYACHLCADPPQRPALGAADTEGSVNE